MEHKESSYNNRSNYEGGQSVFTFPPPRESTPSLFASALSMAVGNLREIPHTYAIDPVNSISGCKDRRK